MEYLARYQTMIFNYIAVLVNGFAIIWNTLENLTDSTLILGLMGILAAQAAGVYGIKKNADVKIAQATGDSNASQ